MKFLIAPSFQSMCAICPNSVQINKQFWMYSYEHIRGHIRCKISVDVSKKMFISSKIIMSQRVPVTRPEICSHPVVYSPHFCRVAQQMSSDKRVSHFDSRFRDLHLTPFDAPCERNRNFFLFSRVHIRSCLKRRRSDVHFSPKEGVRDGEEIENSSISRLKGLAFQKGRKMQFNNNHWDI